MSRALPKIAALFAVWLVLSGRFDPIHAALGLLVAAGIAWLHPVDPASPFRSVAWVKALLYLPWLFGRILRSGLHLTRLILDPSLPIEPRLIRHRTDLESDGALVLLGNSITLTPGTITVDVDSRELVVHAIDAPSSRELTDKVLERRIGGIFGARPSAP